MNSYNVDMAAFQLEVSACRVRYSDGTPRNVITTLLKVGTHEKMINPQSPLFTSSLLMVWAVIMKDCRLRGLEDVSVMVMSHHGARITERLSEIFLDTNSKINFNVFNGNS